MLGCVIKYQSFRAAQFMYCPSYQGRNYSGRHQSSLWPTLFPPVLYDYNIFKTGMVSLFYLIIYMEAAKLCKQTAAAAAFCLHNFAEPAEKSPSKHF